MAQKKGVSSSKKTTARKGTTKSAQARARSEVRRSAAGGRAQETTGESRTVGRKAPRARTSKPGPGDVRAERVQRRRGSNPAK